jgi:pyrophosphate--fructose-6-phosphate 1-phosphotransferase
MISMGLESYRVSFQPLLPSALQDMTVLDCVQDRHESIDGEIQAMFPHLEHEWIMRIVPTSVQAASRLPLRVGVVLSGGPAPGGHTVIAGLFDAVKAWHQDSSLIGFTGGPQGLLKDTSRVLTREEIDAVRNTGGFSLIGTGRHAIATEEEIAYADATVQRHALDGLVFIGGDDSNTDAAFLAEAFRHRGRQTVVVGVPKTIDGDLQSPEIPISFGFDTACKVYSTTIGNISKDCLSTRKYYFFIRLMGRVASHITLECALQTQPNLALVSEEIAARGTTLADVVQDISDLVKERYALGRTYGIVLIPEGVIEHFSDIRQLMGDLNDLVAPGHSLAPEIQRCTTLAERLACIVDHLGEPSKSCLVALPVRIQEQLVRERDPHGNVQVSQIETAGLLAQLVAEQLHLRAAHTGTAIPFSYQTAFCGYEGRSAFPSHFDCTYCYALGRIAAVLIARRMTGYMTAIRDLHRPPCDWQPCAVPLVSLLHFERRSGVRKPVIKKTLVDLSGELFRYYAQRRASWRLEDAYVQPGPMQFFGPDHVVHEPCLSVALRPSGGNRQER